MTTRGHLIAQADRVIGLRGGRVAFDRARADVGEACFDARDARAADDPATPASLPLSGGAVWPQGA